MTDATEATGRNSLGRTGSPLLIVFRLAIGLLQGGALWWLFRSTHGRFADVLQLSWPATVPDLFGPLAMIFVMVPVLLLAGVGRMRWMTLLFWALGATAFLALLSWHGVVSQGSNEFGPGSRPPFLPWPMPLFAATALFIGHHLVLPADMERRWIAAFPTYFDTAWKAGVQLALSIGFTGAFWLLLFLGSALFHVIGLDFLSDLIGKDWFSIPVTTLVFATAVHLTDVRDGLIRGVRSVVLMLLSWLLLLMTVLAAGFLAALPFTGLQGLWDTGSATALVLAAAAALIILVNTAYQDGRADNLPPVVLRVTVRVAAVLLTPLVVIAFWGLALRIGQHGLTPDRIIAFACAVIGAAYAAGYGWAALSPFWRKGAGWMRPLERTNVWTAGLEIAVILALFSPIADPARLSVADQVARLERGAVKPEEFDYRFLRFESGKAGEVALSRLVLSSNPAVGAAALAALKSEYRHDARAVEEDLPIPSIEIWPVGAAPLPAGIVAPANRYDLQPCQPGNPCLATRRDLNGDGTMEILVTGRTDVWVFGPEGDDWSLLGFFRQHCRGDVRPDPREALRAGRLRAVQPAWPDLVFADGRQVAQFHSDRIPDCESEPSAPIATAGPLPPPVAD